MTAPATQPLLQAIEISKRFDEVLANDAVSLDLRPHEIHALLGENGAGKSTLVRVMYGLIQPSSGELRWQGDKIELAGPAQARALGIGMVFQHFSLFENLTVAENVALGLPPSQRFGEIAGRLAEVSRAYGLPLEPRREVWRLSVGERQRIEIVRALMQNPRLLILDEPTAVLTPGEVDQLFAVLRRLKDEGRTILYISHKLEEVKRLCDTATILRAGRKVATCDPRRETAASLARMMVGAEVGPVRTAPAHHVGAPRLRVDDLSLAPDDPHGTRSTRAMDLGRWLTACARTIPQRVLASAEHIVLGGLAAERLQKEGAVIVALSLRLRFREVLRTIVLSEV